MSVIPSHLSPELLQNGVERDEASKPAPADAQLRAKAKDAAEKFEAYFIAQMLRQARRSAREFASDTEPSKKSGEEMLDWGDQLLADVLAGQHAFGIADVMLRQLLPATGQQQDTTRTQELNTAAVADHAK